MNDNIEQEALKNTTAGKVSELQDNINRCGIPLRDLVKASQFLGDQLNSVPPFTYHRATPRKILSFFWLAMLLIVIVLGLWALFQINKY